MPSFMLRHIDPELWAKVHARATSEGLTIKQAVLEALRLYAGVDSDAFCKRCFGRWTEGHICADTEGRRVEDR